MFSRGISILVERVAWSIGIYQKISRLDENRLFGVIIVADSSEFFPWNPATGTNITEEIWEELKKLTQQSKIVTENIENVYETGESGHVKVTWN